MGLDLAPQPGRQGQRRMRRAGAAMSVDSGGTPEGSGKDAHAHRPLAHSMAAGTAWVVGARTAVRMLGVVSTIILARLLVPADFGLVALATLVAASLERLSAFNFTIWLVRHPKPEREHYDTVWTMVVLRGVVTAVVMLVTAAPLAAFFDQPALKAVLAVLAAGQIMAAVQNVGIVDFQKHLRFHKEFQMLVVVKVGAFIITVGSALALRSYWALVAGLMAGHALGLVLSYFLHPFRPRFSLSHWRDVFHFSKWVLAGSLTGFLYGRLDTFFIGKLLATQALGLYAVAREVADMASSLIVIPLRRVLLPGYAKLNEDPQRMRTGFVDGFAIVLLLGAPFALGIGLVAEPLVRVLLGEQWLASIPLIEVLAIYALTAIASANQAPVLLAMGRTRTLAALVAAGLILLAPALALAVPKYGLVGAAWAVSVVNGLVVGAGVIYVASGLNVRMMSIFERIWPTILSLVAMGLAVTLVTSWTHDAGGGAVAQLAAGVAAGAVVYIVAVVGLWTLRGRPQGAEHKIMELVHRRRAQR